VRATKDSDLLVPDGVEADAAVGCFLTRIEATRLHDDKALEGADIAEADHLRVRTRHGIVDVMRADPRTSAISKSWRISTASCQ
jgi:hypothetical protein